MKKNIMITGAGPNGFIGRNLKEGLQYKYNVFAPPRLELDLLDDTKVKAYVVNNKIDVVVHGAVHVPQFNGAQNEMENDMLMFLNIEKISNLVEKVIYFGSGAEYDKRFHITKVREEQVGESIPITSYGLAKYIMNKLARNSSNIYNLRLFGVFGKYELWEIKFISNLCCKALYDLPMTIRKNCNFDFLYIDDLVKIVEWFIENKPIYHDYNVCKGKSYTLLELAQLVKQVTQKDVPIYMLSEEQGLDYTGDHSRLIQEMTNFKMTSMEEAITQLYSYYEKHRKKIEVEILKKTK